MPIHSGRPLSPPASAALNDLRRIVQALRASSRAAQQTLGISGAQLFVLETLAAGGTLSLNELAGRTHTHQSTVSVVIKRLAQRRLVSRAPSRLDGRRIELSVTPAGRALLRRSPGAAQERLIRGLERLSERQRRVLATALDGLATAMGLDGQEPSMFFEEESARGRRSIERVSTARLGASRG